jgi:hypothetical protein
MRARKFRSRQFGPRKIAMIDPRPGEVRLAGLYLSQTRVMQPRVIELGRCDIAPVQIHIVKARFVKARASGLQTAEIGSRKTLTIEWRAAEISLAAFGGAGQPHPVQS